MCVRWCEKSDEVVQGLKCFYTCVERFCGYILTRYRGRDEKSHCVEGLYIEKLFLSLLT